MKTLGRTSLLILSLFLFLNQGMAQKLSVMGNVGFSLPKAKNFDSGLESGFGFVLSLHQKISLAFEFGYWKSQVDEETDRLFNGDLSVNPFFLSFHYSPFNKNKLTPYILLGACMIFNKFKIGDIITIPELTINQKIENGIGFQAGIGSTFKATNNYSVFVEAVYFFHKTTGITTFSDLNFGTTTEEFSLDLNSLILRVGLKFHI